MNTSQAAAPDNSTLPWGRAQPPALDQLLLAMLINELANGVVILDLDGRVLHVNTAARAEMLRSPVLAVEDGRLHWRADDAKVLYDAMQRALDGRHGLVNLRHEESSLTLAVVPLRGETEIAPVRLALFFARADARDTQMLACFARSQRLSTTEEQVLGILCQGYSTPEVARLMKVAVSTVRSHVRSMCSKTRSSGVRELMSKVSMLPAIALARVPDRMH